MFIVSNYPHPTQVLDLGKESLRNLSKEHNLKLRNSTIKKLLHTAKTAYTRPYEELEVEIRMLKLRLNDLENADAKIEMLDDKIEEYLVQTPGVLLLSTPEIGVTTAAEFTVELGPIEQYRYAAKKPVPILLLLNQVGRIISMVQISKQGKPFFRRVIYLIGYNLVTEKTNPYFRQFADRLRERGKKV